MNGHAVIHVARLQSRIVGDAPATALGEVCSYHDPRMADYYNKRWLGWEDTDRENGSGEHVYMDVARGRLGGRLSEAGEEAKKMRNRVQLFNVLDMTFPTGLINVVKNVLEDCDYSYEIVDDVAPPPSMYNGELKLRDKYRGEPLILRDYQEEALKLSRKFRYVMYELATNAGKTLIASAIIADKGVKTLILVQSKEMVRQWVVDFITPYLGIRPGVLSGNNRILRPVTIGLVNTVQRMLEGGGPVAEQLQRYKFQALMVDEAHHAASTMHVAVAREIDPFYMYGFTGTARRTNKSQEIALTANFGQASMHIDNEFMWKQGYSKPIHPRVFPVKQPRAVGVSYGEAYEKLIVRSDARNEAIANVIKDLYEAGHTLLVLVHQIEHCKEISKHLLGKDVAFEVGHSGIPDDERARMVTDFKSGRLRVLIGTLYRESHDNDKVSVVINAGAMKNSIAVAQGLGRGMRVGEHAECVYVDFLDYGSHYLTNHSYNRLKAVEAAGCVLPENATEFMKEVERTTECDMGEYEISADDLAELQGRSNERECEQEKEEE
jgi:superfamily II DNA or RNA helicase